ncbi:MAG: 4-hydroxythreonine-4-phosphate dehydrogenase PdxA [Deltaproteobacteria bacterium]|jgi:4-hydroxythreonine-4-phosphate dehydrogenase|nr:4-hydroxythreonine-4-phosphate dehydrogenase PdxA [Deltaproteobacteria bacterium]MBW2532015.1 4-hydroxythreonine-4-phosphate dehydrogenase PdxA [Deltaproteobacteria bacterium]
MCASLRSDRRREGRPRVAITLGDPAGIGPEILAKMLARGELGDSCTPVVVGDARLVRRAFEIVGAPEHAPRVFAVTSAAQLGQADAGAHLVLDLNNLGPDAFELGRVDAGAGGAAGQFIATAIELALDGTVDAVVTNPIHKEAFRLGGWGERYPGHTEMFAALTGSESTCMMLACGTMRVCHVTTHVSLLEALTHHIKRRRIAEVIRLADQACRSLGIERPRIGVAGINPHAGQDTLFGDEERREIAPAIADAGAAGIDAEGPIAADTLFCKALGGMFDAAVAMYHDQGHIPVKLAGFRYDHESRQWDMRGVNVTLGLPIIRTSVDHGTAFDQAGTGAADHRSLVDAVRYAVRLATS